MFGLLSSAQFFIAEKPVRTASAFIDLASHILIFYWAWAVLTPLVVHAANRVISRRAQWLEQALMILGLCAALLAVHGALYLSLVRVFGVDPGTHLNGAGLSAYLFRHGGGDLATLGVLIAACYFVDATRRSRQREIESSAIAARLSKADLEILRWRLQPHFLFNALNTVSTLVIKGNSAEAENAIALISKYLRSVLEQEPDAIVSVREEISMVEKYVAIERLRFADFAGVEVSVSHDALAARLPGQLVQPLIENAMLHGDTSPNASEPIRLVGSLESERLRLTISNRERSGAAASVRESNGFGLRYVRERLAHFYGENASLSFTTDGGVATATLDVPA